MSRRQGRIANRPKVVGKLRPEEPFRKTSSPAFVDRLHERCMKDAGDLGVDPEEVIAVTTELGCLNPGATVVSLRLAYGESAEEIISSVRADAR